jgi:hypothetical protein
MRHAPRIRSMAIAESEMTSFVSVALDANPFHWVGQVDLALPVNWPSKWHSAVVRARMKEIEQECPAIWMDERPSHSRATARRDRSPRVVSDSAQEGRVRASWNARWTDQIDGVWRPADERLRLPRDVGGETSRNAMGGSECALRPSTDSAHTRTDAALQMASLPGRLASPILHAVQPAAYVCGL